MTASARGAYVLAAAIRIGVGQGLAMVLENPEVG